jgi:hypothetical protein
MNPRCPYRSLTEVDAVKSTVSIFFPGVHWDYVLRPHGLWFMAFSLDKLMSKYITGRKTLPGMEA